MSLGKAAGLVISAVICMFLVSMLIGKVCKWPGMIQVIVSLLVSIVTFVLVVLIVERPKK